MSGPVSYERKENIGIITVNNPPVNALSQAVRAGLSDCLKEALNDSAAEAVIVTGGGRTFMAGADISEFGKPTMSPDLNTVIFEYEDSSKPTIAALHGTPLGGGLEVSMGCHYRVARGKIRYFTRSRWNTKTSKISWSRISSRNDYYWNTYSC